MIKLCKIKKFQDLWFFSIETILPKHDLMTYSKLSSQFDSSRMLSCFWLCSCWELQRSWPTFARLESMDAANCLLCRNNTGDRLVRCREHSIPYHTRFSFVPIHANRPTSFDSARSIECSRMSYPSRFYSIELLVVRS